MGVSGRVSDEIQVDMAVSRNKSNGDVLDGRSGGRVRKTAG